MDDVGLMKLLQYALHLVDKEDEEEQEEYRIKSVRTFEETGLLTSNKGLVLETKDGSEFQITIVQSKYI